MNTSFYTRLISKLLTTVILFLLFLSNTPNLSAQCSPDVTPPVFNCHTFINVSLNFHGEAYFPYSSGVEGNGPTDECDGNNLNYLYQLNNEAPTDSLIFNCDDIGTNTVTLWVSDQSGNTDSCIMTVSVEDKLAPVMVCEIALVVSLPPSGQKTITPLNVDDGSFDNCGPIELKIQLNGIGPWLDSITFDCSNIGDNYITLSDIDTLNSCWTSVTVKDPLGICTPISITGKVFNDTIANCLLDNVEAGIANTQVMVYDSLTGTSQITFTDADGNYSFTTSINPGAGDLAYEISLPNIPGIILPCGISHTLIIPAGQTSGHLDFPVFSNGDCPLLTVDLSTSRLLRCFSNNTYYVSYCNYSTEWAETPFIEVTFDDLVTPTASSIPWTSVTGNTYRFDVPDMVPFECSTFSITVSVDCAAQQLQTLCAEATISPFDLCTPPNANWSGAIIEAESFCDGNNVGFKLKNIGTGNMVQTMDYVIVEDLIMYMTNPFQLEVGEEEEIILPINGSTWRLEAPQESGYPGDAQPIAWMEGCGGINNTGLVTIFPTNNTDPNHSIFCIEVTGAYDPNDKQGFPRGLEQEHFISANQPLDYLIRFQNTGTDTAYTVVVLDTLDQHLNFPTIRPGASSHDYEFEISEHGVIKFTFNNILLPDSIVNEPASHGFVKFKIGQLGDLPEGTLIENRAAIYFDFNEPIITNTTWHTIEYTPIATDIAKPLNPNFQIKASPNPFSKEVLFKIEGQQIAQGLLMLYDLTGRQVIGKPFSGNQFQLNRQNLPPGIYLYKIQDGHNYIGLGKIIVE